jgi:hypothetical protein
MQTDELDLRTINRKMDTFGCRRNKNREPVNSPIALCCVNCPSSAAALPSPVKVTLLDI